MRLECRASSTVPFVDDPLGSDDDSEDDDALDSSQQPAVTMTQNKDIVFRKSSKVRVLLPKTAAKQCLSLLNDSDSLPTDVAISPDPSSKKVGFSFLAEDRKSEAAVSQTEGAEPDSSSKSAGVSEESLIQAESRGQGRMGLRMLTTYLSLSLRSSIRSRFAGIVILFWMIAVYICVFVSRWAADMQLGKWAEIFDAHADRTKNNFLPGAFQDEALAFFIKFTYCVVAMFLFSILVQYSIVKTVTKASKRLYENALAGVLRASVPLFFDVTPVGRIANRLGKDVHSLDLTLSDSVTDFFWAFSQCCVLVATCIVAVPWFALFMIPMLLVIFFLQKIYRSSSREIKRLESMASSPVFSSLDEFLSGASTVRTSGMIHYAENVTAGRLNANMKMFLTSNALQRWLNLRLDILAAVASLTASLCVFLLLPQVDSSSAVDQEAKLKFAGTCLTSVVQLATILPWCTRFYCNTDNSLTSVERLLELQHVPAESNTLQAASAIPLAGDHFAEMSQKENKLKTAFSTVQPLTDSELETFDAKTKAVMLPEHRKTALLIQPTKVKQKKSVAFREETSVTSCPPSPSSIKPSEPRKSSSFSTNNNTSRRKSKFLKRRSEIGSMALESRRSVVRLMADGVCVPLPLKWPTRGDVEFKDVFLRYRPSVSSHALKGVSFSVEGKGQVGESRGTILGVCGRSGAGKSSLLQALFRIVEIESGSIFIDGIDHRSVGLETLRSRLSIIPQEPVLFSGTVRENLDPGYAIPTSVLWSALESVHMAGEVRDLFNFSTESEQAGAVERAKDLIQQMGKKFKLRTNDHTEKEIKKILKKKNAISRRRSSVHMMLDKKMLGIKDEVEKESKQSSNPLNQALIQQQKEIRLGADGDTLDFTINQLHSISAEDDNDDETLGEIEQKCAQPGFYDYNAEYEDAADAFLNERPNVDDWYDMDSEDGDDGNEAGRDSSFNGFASLPGDRGFLQPSSFVTDSGSFPTGFVKDDELEMGGGRHGYPLIAGVDAREIWLSQTVSEQGSNFSSGQRQLLCVARALIRGSRIVVLDEASSSMDNRSNALLQSAVRNLLKGSTVIMIAHRLETIACADKVIVIDDGRVVEQGSPAELLQNRWGFLSGLANEMAPDGREKILELAIQSRR
eukprot:GDKJ01015907.1.p1 GENE.GDKJ01015907.1~~GDKJ01015907.1.p1  ORF type:complete len:1138 (+),score=264.03 GDKJ01015907.1:3-3416(+)